jgi:hypothetical protein
MIAVGCAALHGVDTEKKKKRLGDRTKTTTTTSETTAAASGGPADVSRAKLLKKFDQNFLLPFGRVWFTPNNCERSDLFLLFNN